MGHDLAIRVPILVGLGSQPLARKFNPFWCLKNVPTKRTDYQIRYSFKELADLKPAALLRLACGCRALILKTEYIMHTSIINTLLQTHLIPRNKV